MNAIQLTGRLTKDPELHITSDGITVCRLRLAVERMGRQNVTGYVDVSSFGKPAQACGQVLAKGWLVGVDGYLAYSEWDTADGAKRSGHSVVGHVEFLAAPRGAGAENAAVKGADGADIPF